MRLKSFYARTMTEAMQMVRDTLGDDAVIVATREERASRTVHVTAAIDSAMSAPAFEIGRPARQQPAEVGADWLQYDEEEDTAAIAEELTDVLLRHGVTEDVMDQIISCATIVGMERPSVALVASLEHLFNFKPLPQKAARKPIMAVGMPGAGKTLAVAKIAARSVMNSLKVAVITTDSVRAGGYEQLESFTRLLRIPLHKAGGPDELRDLLEQTVGYDQLLIDTAGLNPFNGDEVKYLAKLIAASDSEPYLVLPAGSDADESADIARIFGTLGVHGLIPTRLDIARRLGGLLSAASQGSMVFADASNTPKVADGLFTLTPQTMAELLMPAAFTGNKKTGARQ